MDVERGCFIFGNICLNLASIVSAIRLLASTGLPFSMTTKRSKYRVGGKACAAFGCSNTAYSVPKVSLHVFPNPERDGARHLAWVKAVKRTRAEWDGPPAKRSPAYENCVLCSEHFDDACFEEISEIKRQSGYKCRSTILKPDAVPTNFFVEQDSIQGKKQMKAHEKPDAVISISDDNCTESKGMVIPVNEIPSSTVPASDLCKRSSTKRSRKKGVNLPRHELIQVSPQEKLDETPKKTVEKLQQEPLNHNCLALLHHDYIRTMTKSLKNYILSKQILLRCPPLKSRKIVSDDKSCGAPPVKHKLVKEGTMSKGDQRKKRRKRKSLLMYGGKTKLERNPGLVKSSLRRKSSEEAPCKAHTTDPSTPTTPKENKSPLSDTQKSCNSSSKKPKKRKCLTLYHGKSKLERNPHLRYRRMRERQLFDKISKGASVKEEPTWEAGWPEKTVDNELAGGDKDHSQSYEKHLLQSLYTMQKCGTLCDFTITVGSPRTLRQFPVLVHKLIFSSVSNKIKSHKGDILDASQHLTKLDAPKIIEFVYTGEIRDIKLVAQDEIQRLHKAAVFLEIPKCVSYLVSCEKVEEPSVRNCKREVPPLLFPPSPLSKVARSFEGEIFDLADIRIKRVVSQAIDTTDTSSDEDPLKTLSGD